MFFHQMMTGNLRGELTPLSNSSDDNNETDDIVTAIGRALGMCSVEEHDRLQDLLVPELFRQAVLNSDINRMEQLLQHVSHKLNSKMKLYY